MTDQVPPVENTSIIAPGDDPQETRAMAEAAAQVRGAIMMARHLPRDETASGAKIIKMCQRPAFADDARYSYPRGGKTVSGPSVRLARPMATAWGNIDFGFRVLRDDGDNIIIEAYGWDLESNTRVTQQASFKNLIQRKNKGWIKPDEREKRELINKHGAVALRNCILQLLPFDLVEDAMEACAATVAKGFTGEDRDKVIRRITGAFLEYGIKIEDLQLWLGRQRGQGGEDKLQSVSPDEIVMLQGIYTSIRDGNSTPAEHFPVEPDATPEANGKLDPAKMGEGDPGFTPTGSQKGTAAPVSQPDPTPEPQQTEIVPPSAPESVSAPAPVPREPAPPPKVKADKGISTLEEDAARRRTEIYTMAAEISEGNDDKAEALVQGVVGVNRSLEQVAGTALIPLVLAMRAHHSKWKEERGSGSE